LGLFRVGGPKEEEEVVMVVVVVVVKEGMTTPLPHRSGRVGGRWEGKLFIP